MLKIYPSPFNKLAFFILYGLLSVAAITLAQAQDGENSGCPLAPPGGQITIGYVHIENVTDPPTIKWEYYDYINVIAYPATDTPWNELHPPQDTQDAKRLNNTLTNLVNSKGNSKVLFSIRNFNALEWPNNDAEYGKFVDEIGRVVNGLKLDGVDIEYPGMRGLICKSPANPSATIWDQDNDQYFVKFLRDIRNSISNKTLMLTAGDSTINGLDNGLIDYVNIETYHYSFYDSYNYNDTGKVRSNPNAPFDVFKKAHSEWTKAGIGDEKIIMGIDLGNTFQILDNQNITSSQTVETGIHDSNEISDVTRLSQINFCPGGNNADKLKLYLFPWNRFNEITSSDNCSTNSYAGWEYHFDKGTFTPWLTKNTSTATNSFLNNNMYYYISFENIFSLNSKLKSSTIGGISISDILHDSDSDSLSLVKFIQPIREPGPTNSGSPSASGNSASGIGPSETATNGNQNEGNRKPEPGVIAGAVIGSVFGLIIISGILFLGYRHRDKLPFGQNQYEKNMMMYNTHGTHNPGMIPEGSPRMIIPETTAVPVAPSYVTAMFDFAGKEENDLSFKKGDKIEVLERGDGPNDWWVGRVNGAVGEFPGNYVKE